MPNIRTLLKAFSGGELSPEMLGRTDDTKFQSGAARLRNFGVTAHGAAVRRPGFSFVAETKDSGPARLVPFQVSATDSIVIEVGAGYFRFHTTGGTVSLDTTAPEYKPNTPFIPASLGWPLFSYDPGTGVITTLDPHGLVEDQEVVFTLGPGGVMHGPFAENTPYYAHVVDATHFSLDDADPFSAALTGGTGGHNVLVWPNGANVITFAVPHGLETNDPVAPTIDSGSALPSPLGPGSRYYVEKISDTAIMLKGSPTTPTYEFDDMGTVGGQFRMNYDYRVADLASYELDPMGAPGVFTNFYCYVVPTVNGAAQEPPTNASYWLQLDGLTYEIPNSFTTGQLFDLTYAQSNDVLTLTVRGVLAAELRRYDATQWELVVVDTSGSMLPPTVSGAATRGQSIVIQTIAGSPNAITTVTNHLLAEGDVVLVYDVAGGVPIDGLYLADSPSGATTYLKSVSTGLRVDVAGAYTGSSGKLSYASLGDDNTHTYVVTSVGAQDVESLASVEVVLTNNLFVGGSFNTITWTAPASGGTPLRYNVYKKQTGLFGFIGTVDAEEPLSFVDDNIAPDMGINPPLRDATLNTSTASAPGAVAYFEQRRVFGGTTEQPQSVWMSRAGTEADFGYSLPIKDNDRVYFAVASLRQSTIRHILPMSQLLLLTDSAEYRASPVNSDALTPASVAVRPHSYVGANSVHPQIVNSTAVFCAARGGHVREIGFSADADSYVTGDLSLRSAHLFDSYEIVDMAFTKSPMPVLWFVSTNGRLLGLTYVPEERVGAWHWHDTAGAFESCCVVEEGTSEDALYVIVQRTIDGVQKRYIERLTNWQLDEVKDSIYLDSASTLASVTPVTTVSGLAHLEGETVDVLADGLVQTSKVVQGGEITLDTAALKVQVGLPFTSELITLPVAMQIEAMAQGREKNVNKVWVRVFESSVFELGPTSDDLVPSSIGEQADDELLTGEVEVVATGSWTDDGQVMVRQTRPLPVTVVALVLQVSIGG